MIKSLQLHILHKKASGISFCNGIHTNRVLLAKFNRRKIPRALFEEPGMKSRRDYLQEDSDYFAETIDEAELDDDINMMNLGKLHDIDIRRNKRFQGRVNLKITAQKFFSSRPQPSMLTHNEKLCIKHLHKEDPVQWDFKTLSESFPATPDIIKKVIKSKLNITPEKRKVMDMRVQKNWELLAKGELNADAHVLEHLKKFVNRREILLEQIKNEKFYLPEIKKEPVWNQGEMTSIIIKYENEIKKLVQENSHEALTDGMSAERDETKKSSLDLLQKQIEAESKNLPEKSDSFIFGKMLKTYSKHTTLEELENKILEKADKKKLDITENVILENKLGVRRESYDNLIKSPTNNELEEGGGQAENQTDRQFNERVDFRTNQMRFNRTELKEFSRKNRMRLSRTNLKEFSPQTEYTPPDENTFTGSETDVGKILDDVLNKSQEEEEEKEKEIVIKKEVNFSDTERIKRQNEYYDNEVLHIENTAFWNNKKSSKEKEKAEDEKTNHGGPVSYSEWTGKPKFFLLNPDPYPEKIKIPKNYRRSGLTFRIKDCYYDDDGEFLYRVPGMTK